MRFVDKDVNAKQLSPLNLAFIGDCIYEILVRETLVLDANRPVTVSYTHLTLPTN